MKLQVRADLNRALNSIGKAFKYTPSVRPSDLRITVIASEEVGQANSVTLCSCPAFLLSLSAGLRMKFITLNTNIKPNYI